MDLKDIFSNVNDQLRFAETKNASLIAFNGLLLFGMIRIHIASPIEGYMLYILYLLVFCVFVSVLKSILSFFPQLKNVPSSNNLRSNNNLIFFGSIQNMSSREFLDLYYEKASIDEENRNEIDLDIANQIIVNSQIAQRKFEAFKVSAAFSAASAATGFILLLCFLS